MSADVLILPGIGDSGPLHWQTAWERAVPGARRVAEPDWAEPACATWVASLARAVAAAAPGVVLVAHSLGCLQVANWARGAVRPVRVGGALLVAPPDPDGPAFPALATGFRPLARDRLPFPSVICASRDDPYADFDFARRLAADWGSRLVDVGCCGHINAASGLGAWTDGLALLGELTAGAVLAAP